MTHLNRRLFLTGTSGLLAAAFPPASAKTTVELLSPAAMRRDIAILVDAYASLHPGLHRYLTPAGFQRERQRLDRFAAIPRTLGAFYLALSAFTASIRCGHSFPNPANQTPAIASALFGKPDRLPFAFAWLDRRMIVTADLGSGHSLSAGSEVVAIDCQSASKKDPLSASKRDPSVERRDGHDGRAVRAACGVGRA